MVIEIFAPQGNIEGLCSVKMPGWSGQVCRIPLPIGNDVASTLDFNVNNIVYLIFGEDSTTGEKTVYIGKSTQGIDRFNRHQSISDESYEIIVLSDSGFHETEINALERILIGIANDGNKYHVTNVQVQNGVQLSQPIGHTISSFLANALMIIELLGHDLTTEEALQDDNNTFSNPIGADLVYDPNLGLKFVVLKGSRANKEQGSSLAQSYSSKRTELVISGILVEDDTDAKFYVFTENYEFRSPSQAANVVSGSSTNGRTYWTTANGTTLGEYLGIDLSR